MSEWEVEALQLLFLLSHFHLPGEKVEVRRDFSQSYWDLRACLTFKLFFNMQVIFLALIGTTMAATMIMLSLCRTRSGFHSIEHFKQVATTALVKLSKCCTGWLKDDWVSSSVSTPSLMSNERQKIGETIFDAVVKIALAKEARVDVVLKFRYVSYFPTWQCTGCSIWTGKKY